ncbi:MAG: hypothetical protein KatS3mg122_1671 [Caldimonas sp.]|nr:MAG: hypothetical protein KatS3mg122_1671 [Caldimonas sp.]
MSPMRTMVILVDDAAHTREHMPPLLQHPSMQAQPVEIVLVGCAPRLTHRVSKWVSHGAREHWRHKWAHRLFGELQPWLAARGLRVRCVLARGPLDALLDSLQPDRVVDLRRPKAAAPAVAPPSRSRWQLSLMALGLGALIAWSEV